MIAALLHGIALALGLILPLGAQNVFVFNQGATQPRFRYTLPVIITASLCDAFLIVLAVLGISVIVFTVPLLQIVFYSVGFLFLLFMGWSVWNNIPESDSSAKAPLSVKKQIMFAMSVSLLNPHAILDTVGVIGTSSLVYTGMEKVMFTLATVLVSWVWFFALALVGRIIGNLDGKGRFLIIINKISAIIIWSVSLYILYQIVKIFMS